MQLEGLSLFRHYLHLVDIPPLLLKDSFCYFFFFFFFLLSYSQCILNMNTAKKLEFTNNEIFFIVDTLSKGRQPILI